MKFCQLFIHESESVPSFSETGIAEGWESGQQWREFMGCTWKAYVGGYTYRGSSRRKRSSKDQIRPTGQGAGYCHLSRPSLPILVEDGRRLNKLRNLNNNYGVPLKSHTFLHIIQEHKYYSIKFHVFKAFRSTLWFWVTQGCPMVLHSCLMRVC